LRSDPFANLDHHRGIKGRDSYGKAAVHDEKGRPGKKPGTNENGGPNRPAVKNQLAAFDSRPLIAITFAAAIAAVTAAISATATTTSTSSATVVAASLATLRTLATLFADERCELIFQAKLFQGTAAAQLDTIMLVDVDHQHLHLVAHTNDLVDAADVTGR
jgi:hypothetical protein